MGVVEEFLEAARPVKHFIFADHGKILNKIPSDRGIDSIYPSPVILPQSETEEILERRLASLGVSVERQVALKNFSQEEQGVTAVLSHGNGTQETTLVSYLVGCDGARSAVRHQLGLEFLGETEPGGFVLIDAKVEGDLPEDAIFASWGEAHTVALFPIKKDLFRMVTQRKDLNDESSPTLEEMQGYLEQAGLGRLRFYDPEWLSYFGVNERIASHNYVGDVFLVGDACHIHSPAGGQGMNTGIQDAFNLGWKLKLMIDGVGDPKAIAHSYFQERYPVAKELVEETTQLLHVGITNSTIARVAKDILIGVLLHLPSLQQFFSEKLSAINIHYSNSGLIEHDLLSVDERKYQAGWRAYNSPVVEEATGKEMPLWREFLRTQHTLLVFSGNHLSDERRTLLEELLYSERILKLAPQPLAVWHGLIPLSPSEATDFLDPEGKAHRHFGITSTSWILIRPDLYVAARGFIDEQDRLWEYLEKLHY
jgi:2-polyprenyl-6-methoxyphenol hydroxylase-like FAD-dependent oxidoreductase